MSQLPESAWRRDSSSTTDAPAGRHVVHPIINHDTLRDCYFGDRELLGEIVAVFLANKDEQLADIGAAVASGVAIDIAKTAHKLKGGLMTIGAGAAAQRQVHSGNGDNYTSASG